MDSSNSPTYPDLNEYDVEDIKNINKNIINNNQTNNIYQEN